MCSTIVYFYECKICGGFGCFQRLKDKINDNTACPVEGGIDIASWHEIKPSHGETKRPRGTWCKITMEMRIKIEMLRKLGKSQRKIADELGISQTAVSNVLKGR
jgi:hypothetical protein